MGALEDDDLSLAQALAHVASMAIINERSADDLATVTAQLQHVLCSRVVVDQAKGVLAQADNLKMETTFHVLRRSARDHHRSARSRPRLTPATYRTGRVCGIPLCGDRPLTT